MLLFVEIFERFQTFPLTLTALSPVKLYIFHPTGTFIVMLTFVKLFPLFVIVMFVSPISQGVVATLLLNSTVKFEIPKNIAFESLALHLAQDAPVTSKTLTFAIFVYVPI